MNRRVWLALAGAVVAGVAAGFVVPPLTAVSESSPPAPTVRIGRTATLGAKGATLKVPVTFNCPPGDGGSLQVQVNERSGNGIAQGFGGRNITCTGGIQHVVVTVTAFDKPFKPGTAHVQAFLYECGQFDCTQTTVDRDVRVTR